MADNEISAPGGPRIERLPLPNPSPGTTRTLTVWRFGKRGARPKAYLQAALHADELPGVLVLRALAARLARAQHDGVLEGEVVLVPLANPIGLSQYVFGHSLGRHALEGSGNFNRGYPDLATAVGERIGAELGATADANVALVRRALVGALAEYPANGAPAVLRLTLMRLAVDADIALDLHCDSEAVLHVYTGAALWPQAADLAAQLGARATLLAAVSGGNPFDEALGGPWWSLAERFPRYPLPPACLAATIELRGERDVDQAFAQSDAEALYRFLCRRGVASEDPGPLPASRCAATPLTGVDMIRAPSAGVVCYPKSPGEIVARGTPVAEIIDPLDPDDAGARRILRAGTDGVLFARAADRLARPGQVLVKVAGSEPLADREGGALLTD